MKKILLSLAVVLGSLTQSSAQCTIMPGCSTGTVGYCTTPAANSSLPNAMVSTTYSTVIQVSVGSTAAGGAATINSGTVTSVTGLPTGLTYSTNPTNGVINASSNGCILISGTPGAATAGTYTVTVNVSMSTSLGTFPGSASWTLTVNPATTTGIQALAIAPAALMMSPNPAKTVLNLSADFNIGKVQVLDALGKVVLSQDANNANEAVLDVQQLNNGIYFLQINDGSRVITRKFIKE